MAFVLVTGGTGFIGLHLVEALIRRGERVRCLVRSSSRTEPMAKLGVELAAAELDNAAAVRAALSGIDVVYHVAGIIRAFRTADFYRVNEQGAAQIAAACADQAQPPRLVLVSSIAAAGPCRLGQIRRESDPPAAISHYGRSKLAAERSAERFAANVPLTVVRPSIVFGPRDTGFVQVIQSIKRLHCHLSPGFRSPPLSYIHVTDLVELLLAAAEKGARVPANGAVEPGKGYYFAAAPEHPTYAELGRMLRAMLGEPRAPVIPVPGPLAYGMGALNEVVGRIRGRAEELCRDKIRDALAPSWACSGEAAKRELGFEPARPLVARLEETVGWCFDNKWF